MEIIALITYGDPRWGPSDLRHAIKASSKEEAVLLAEYWTANNYAEGEDDDEYTIRTLQILPDGTCEVHNCDD